MFERKVPSDHKTIRPLQVMVIHNHDSTARRIAEKLAADSDCVEVTQHSKGIAALVQVGITSPDLVVMDLFMPDFDGLEACRQLTQANVAVIAVSRRHSDDLAIKSKDFGAHGYLPLPVTREQLIEAWGIDLEAHRQAMRATRAKEPPVEQVGEHPAPEPVHKGKRSRLTPEKLAAAKQLLAQGKSKKDAAAAVGVAMRTLYYHLRRESDIPPPTHSASPRPRKRVRMTPEMVEEATRLVLDGMSKKAVAETLGVSYSTILNWVLV